MQRDERIYNVIVYKKEKKFTIRNKVSGDGIGIIIENEGKLNIVKGQFGMFERMTIWSKGYEGYGVMGVIWFMGIPFVVIITEIENVGDVEGKLIYKIKNVKCIALCDIEKKDEVVVDYYIENYRKIVIDNYYFSYEYHIEKAFSLQKEELNDNDNDKYIANIEQLQLCRSEYNKIFLNDECNSNNIINTNTSSNSNQLITFSNFFIYCIYGYISSIKLKILKQDISFTFIQRKYPSYTSLNLTNYELIITNYTSLSSVSSFSKEFFSFSNDPFPSFTPSFTSLFPSSPLIILNAFPSDDITSLEHFQSLLDSHFPSSTISSSIILPFPLHYANMKEHQIHSFRINKQSEQMYLKYKYIINDTKNVLIVICKDGIDVSLKIIQRASYDFILNVLNKNEAFTNKTNEIFGMMISYAGIDESNYLYGVKEYESEDLSLVKNNYNSMVCNGSFFNSCISGNICNDNVQTNKKENMYDIYIKGERLNAKYETLFNNLIQHNHNNINNNIINNVPLSLNDNNSFSKKKTITTYIATWNINALDINDPHTISLLNLNELFHPHLHSTSPSFPSSPDIVVISLQEIVQLSTSNILLPDSNKPNVDFWIDTLWESVGKPTYIKLHHTHLVGILLITFIKTDLYPFISDCVSFTKKTGANGFFGNKGFCIHSFNIFGKSFAFAGAHFACGVERNDKRIEEMKTAMEFNIDGKNMFKERDVWFICGDLNFRIDVELRMCMECIGRKELSGLKCYDQCINMIKEQYEEEIFEEGIRFEPSFKYVKGRNEYDLRKRIPSWCDRILYKNTPLIKNIFYDIAKIYVSDHIPVVGLYEINIHSNTI